MTTTNSPLPASLNGAMSEQRNFVTPYGEDESRLSRAGAAVPRLSRASPCMTAQRA